MAKKSFLDSINVPAPCDKNWDEMTGDEQKRFCSGCQKNVFNVSAMPHREASRLIAENAGKICICYTRLPNGRVMTTDQKLHQISRRTSAVAAGVIAATLTFSAMTYAQGGSRIEPQKSGSVSITQIVPPSRSQAKLTVIVTDLNGAVIPKARILLKDIKRNIVSEGLSDNNGFYEFASIQPSVYEIQIIKDGFEPLVKSDVQFAGDKTLEIRIALETASIVGLYVSPEAIESESQKSSAEITSRQLLDLPPSKNRPFIGLVLANSKTKTKRGAIFLTVVDESGTIVPGTQIKLTNQKTKEVFSVLADQDGQAQLGLMLYGKYLVTASAPGFAEYRQIIESSKKVKTNISITLKVMNYPLMGDFTIEDPVTVEKHKRDGNLQSAKNRQNSKIASDTGQISFIIRDQMKAAILGAQIRLVNQKTKAEFFASTDQTGAAQFGLLPPGVYDVLISASAGFRNHRQVVQIKEAVEPNVKITLSTADK